MPREFPPDPTPSWDPCQPALHAVGRQAVSRPEDRGSSGRSLDWSQAGRAKHRDFSRLVGLLRTELFRRTTGVRSRLGVGARGHRRLHQSQHARPDRRGQFGPRRDHRCQLGIGGLGGMCWRDRNVLFVAGIAAARFRNPRIPRRKTRQFGPHRGHCPFPVRSCTPRAVLRSRPPCTHAESSDVAIFVRLEGSIRACGPHHQPPPRTTPPPPRYSVGLSSAGCGRSLSVASPN